RSKKMKKFVLAFAIVASVVSMGMCEYNKYEKICGGMGISKCINFYESSCNNGNIVGCSVLYDFFHMVDEVTVEEMVCQNYNGSVIDSVKKLLKDAKEIKSFIPNSLATKESHKKVVDLILELETFLKNQTQQTKEWQSKKMEFQKNFLSSCKAVGDLLWDTNTNEAIQYYKKACNYGYGESCETLGNIYQDNKSVSPNYLLALEYHEKACDLGVKDSCDKYMQLRKSFSNNP
ncbi:tetratricopeptide repeat protein, partial [Helicobacter sp. T3_23-1059]